MSGRASQAGFTLVEMLTVGVISSVLAGAALSSLYMASDLTLQGSVESRASQRAALASWQIRRMAQSAYIAKAPGSTGPIDDMNASSAVPNAHHVVFVGPPPDYDTIGGFQVLASSNILREYRRMGGTWVWRPVILGRQDTVKISPRPASSFTLYPRRRGLEFRLEVLDENGAPLPASMEKVLCRNQDR